MRHVDKKILVIGGATGIGAATVRRLASEGAKLYVGDVNLAGAEKLAEEIRGQGGDIKAGQVDQSKASDVESAVAAARKWLGGFDGAFFNAAETRIDYMARDTDIATMDLELWQHVMDVNLRGAMLGARAVIPTMMDAKKGSIVFTSSEYGATGNASGGASRAAYSVSKSAIESLSRTIAGRFGKGGVRSNCVVPGTVQTETARRLITPEEKKFYLNAVHSPRLGEPEDIAATVSFLLSDDAEYINGQSIFVNGGSFFH
jgi:NAD(P)-dependent dehydrogenase (short-subunit alcohol dehydrogenase family)